MSFAMLSTLFVGLGLAGLAGLLYALQRLRVQSNELVVATTMFWRAAVREAPVRVFTRRFRHFLAYLLTLLIAGLLWLAFAGPQTDVQAGEDYIIFSSLMAPPRLDLRPILIALLARFVGTCRNYVATHAR